MACCCSHQLALQPHGGSNGKDLERVLFPKMWHGRTADDVRVFGLCVGVEERSGERVCHTEADETLCGILSSQGVRYMSAENAVETTVRSFVGRSNAGGRATGERGGLVLLWGHYKACWRETCALVSWFRCDIIVVYGDEALDY